MLLLGTQVARAPLHVVHLFHNRQTAVVDLVHDGIHLIKFLAKFRAHMRVVLFEQLLELVVVGFALDAFVDVVVNECWTGAQ